MRIKRLILWTLLSTFAPYSFAESWTWTFTPEHSTFTAVKNISRADSTLMQSFSGTYTTDATSKYYSLTVENQKNGTEEAPASHAQIDAIVMSDGLLFADLQLYGTRNNPLIIVPSIRSVGCPGNTLKVNFLSFKPHDNGHGNFMTNALWGRADIPISGSVTGGVMQQSLANYWALTNEQSDSVTGCSDGVISLSGGTDYGGLNGYTTISSAGVGAIISNTSSFVSVRRSSTIALSSFYSKTLYGLIVGRHPNGGAKFQRLLKLEFPSNSAETSLIAINGDRTTRNGIGNGAFRVFQAGTSGTNYEGFVRTSFSIDGYYGSAVCAVDDDFAGRGEMFAFCTGNFDASMSSHGVTFMIYTPGGTLSSNAQKQFLQFTAPYTP